MQLRTACPNTSVGAAALIKQCDGHFRDTDGKYDTPQVLSSKLRRWVLPGLTCPRASASERGWRGPSSRVQADLGACLPRAL